MTELDKLAQTQYIKTWCIQNTGIMQDFKHKFGIPTRGKVTSDCLIKRASVQQYQEVVASVPLRSPPAQMSFSNPQKQEAVQQGFRNRRRCSKGLETGGGAARV